MGKITDIKDLKIDAALPKQKRIESYLEQMANPYEYRDQGMTVRIRFADTEETLTDRLMVYVASRGMA